MLIRHAGRRRVQGGAVSFGRAGRGRTECRHWSEGGRLDLAGVLDRLRDSPPGVRERAQNGSASAKKELQAIHKHNHQVVDRAEVAANPAREELDRRRQADASSHRKRSLARSLELHSDDDV